MAYSGFDSVVENMMRRFGTIAYINVAVSEGYNPETSTNVVQFRKIPVKAMFFDFLDKRAGLGVDNNTLIQSGDKQVFIQPTQKVLDGIPLPHLSPNKDIFEHNGKSYRIIFLKQHNPSMTNDGCVLYELYIRE